jgi:hypothetical protein
VTGVTVRYVACSSRKKPAKLSRDGAALSKPGRQLEPPNWIKGAIGNGPCQHLTLYASWQKGGIENANGRLRRWLPRHLDIDRTSDQDIQEISGSGSLPGKLRSYVSQLAFLRASRTAWAAAVMSRAGPCARASLRGIAAPRSRSAIITDIDLDYGPRHNVHLCATSRPTIYQRSIIAAHLSRLRLSIGSEGLQRRWANPLTHRAPVSAPATCTPLCGTWARM